MRARRSAPTLLPVVAALVAFAAGACGIPDNTGVKEVGPGRSTGATSAGDGDVVQVDREDSDEARQFAANYLRAAAGDLGTAADRLKSFMTPAAAGRFKPAGGGLQVVRLVGDPLTTPGDNVVYVTYEPVGTLDEFGRLEPARETRQDTYEIKVGQLAGKSGLFVTEAPPVLPLDVRALRGSYVQHPLYYWNTEYTGLVPDVRYLPKALPVEQRPTTVLTWLLNGPSAWLSVANLPKGTALKGNVPTIDDNKLQIALSTQAGTADNAEQSVDRLRRQLQWTLRPLLPAGAELDLKIEHQDVRAFSGDDYLTSNPAAQLVDEPERFVVYGGKIRRVSGQPWSVNPVPVLKTEENKDVLAAAMSTVGTRTFAAVVVKAGKGQALRVAGAASGDQAPLQPISGLSGTLGEPVWAPAGDAADGSPDAAIGLIIAGDRLYAFPAGKGAARQIPWTGPGSRITSVAVAPDGRRVALVVDGKLYRASFSPGGDAPSLGTPQQLRPASLATVSAVDFNSEGWLTVAGVRENQRVTIEDVSVDGALEGDRLPDLGSKVVDSLSVYPASPLESNSFDGRPSVRSVCYTSDGKAWEALSQPDQIKADKVAGPPANQAAGTVPLAPFYLE
ncbi:LpqB family beta-propeller domain-containing protein [Actinoplanes oblitus]|uniref:LpqB family beta-propeller domain-containing protein n=1 Tax=Actinoplanes oblitus TaxID=3040509 RepID=A0ABY8WIZ1_9ACTN|nr:LpqB family beta-propeller domain-containing protein [Actinoplanes oblitus]WIM97382.1 LpqB family beta-propeller domain-containing protein [Actinoplanes oblitus]